MTVSVPLCVGCCKSKKMAIGNYEPTEEKNDSVGKSQFLFTLMVVSWKFWGKTQNFIQIEIDFLRRGNYYRKMKLI